MTPLEESTIRELARLGQEVDDALHVLFLDARDAMRYGSRRLVDQKLAEARRVNRRGELMLAYSRLVFRFGEHLPGNVSAARAPGG